MSHLMKSVALAAALLLPASAHAALYEWRFDGTLTNVIQPASSTVFAVGDPYSARIVIDGDYPDGCQAEAVGNYISSAETLTVGSQVSFSVALAGFEINSDPQCGFRPGATYVRLVGVSGGPTGMWEGGFYPTGIPLGGALPIALPDGSTASFSLGSAFGYRLSGTGTAMIVPVPEPASAVLTTLGVAALSLVRRRRR